MEKDEKDEVITEEKDEKDEVITKDAKDEKDEKDTGKGIEEISKSLELALSEIEVLKEKLEIVTRERDEANALFMKKGIDSENNEKTYNDILGDIKK